jgi:hypothetical protein
MPQHQPAEGRTDTLLRRFFPFYCLLTALVTFGYALYDPYAIDGDAIAYMDIGDNLRAHLWPGIVNGYWHPMYPAFLSAGHILLHATLPTELHAYYLVNFAIFLLEMIAVVAFTDAILRLRETLATDQGAPCLASETWESRLNTPSFLLTKYSLRYLGLALLTIASQRELSLGKVRPDALLQAFLLLALAALLTHLATRQLRYAALLGLALGCAYLTKSFAFVFALLCIAVLAAFRWLWLRHQLTRIVPAAALALLVFGLVSGPYIAALSRQHGRLDFGDSGALNYAWYVGNTEKMHLEPYMTDKFGSADVHLKHPEKELLHSPQILSYVDLPYGTYPDWFDTTYWNDQVKPHFYLRGEISRSARNAVLVVRYLFNHPEALILLALLLVLGARPALNPRPSAGPFWLPPLALGVLAWTIYGTVNTEERYVTFAYLCIVLPLFATLRKPEDSSSFWPSQNLRIEPSDSLNTSAPPIRRLLPALSSLLPLFLALLATGESLRTVLEDRRQLSLTSAPGGWYSPTEFRAAAALAALGVRPGDTVACVGEPACLNDFYWARLAHVRILTEIYDPETPLVPFFAGMPNRDQALATVRATGARALIGDFGTARVSTSDPTFAPWRQLDTTTLYALPLNP